MMAALIRPEHDSAQPSVRAVLAEALAAAPTRRRRMQFEPRISLITLGVSDLAASTGFYETLGFPRHRGQSSAEISFFALGGGLVLALFGRDALADDAGQAPFAGRSAISLAYNTRSELEVDKLVASFVVAGGSLAKPPARTPWGGYGAYVADPDGHLWEIAHNPFWTFDGNGGIVLPEI